MKFVPNPGAIAELAESDQVADGILKPTIQVEAEAKRVVRVDTGRLRSSITHDVRTDRDGVFGVVGTDVDYGPHVEVRFPFLRAALSKVLGVRRG